MLTLSPRTGLCRPLTLNYTHRAKGFSQTQNRKLYIKHKIILNEKSRKKEKCANLQIRQKSDECQYYMTQEQNTVY